MGAVRAAPLPSGKAIDVNLIRLTGADRWMRLRRMKHDRQSDHRQQKGNGSNQITEPVVHRTRFRNTSGATAEYRWIGSHVMRIGRRQISSMQLWAIFRYGAETLQAGVID